MANYPATIKPNNTYVGTFPEISKPFQVLLNGADAPAIITELPGGGWRVEIEAADVQIPGGSVEGSIVVSDATHTFSTVIRS